MTASNIYGRQVVLPLTNKSGSGVIAGDVVIVDTTNNDAFTTSTSAATTNILGVAQDTIANNATGRVLLSGYAALVNTNASVTRGHYGQGHSVAKQAADAGAARQAGTFCQFLTGGTTPDAYVFATADLGTGAGGSVATDAIWTTAGQLVAATGSSTAAVITAAATGKVLASGGVGVVPAYGYLPFHGCVAYNAGTQTLGTAVETLLTFDSEEFDTDGFHSTASNTGRMTIPAGMGGYYTLRVEGYWNTDPGGTVTVAFKKNGTLLRGKRRTQASASGQVFVLFTTRTLSLAAADYIEVTVYNSGTTPQLGLAGYETMFECIMVGV